MFFTNVVDKQYPGGDIHRFSNNNREPYIYTGKLLTSTGIKIGKGNCTITSGYYKGCTLDIFFSASGSGAPSDGRAVLISSNSNDKYECIYREGKRVNNYNSITFKPEVSSVVVYIIIYV